MTESYKSFWAPVFEAWEDYDVGEFHWNYKLTVNDVTVLVYRCPASKYEQFEWWAKEREEEHLLEWGRLMSQVWEDSL